MESRAPHVIATPSGGAGLNGSARAPALFALANEIPKPAMCPSSLKTGLDMNGFQMNTLRSLPEEAISFRGSFQSKDKMPFL